MKKESTRTSLPLHGRRTTGGSGELRTLTSLLRPPRLPYPLLFSWGQNVQKSTQQGVTPAQ